MQKTTELIDLLIANNYTVSFAESCTGGMLASSVVDIPNASKVFNASFVTYSNESKIQLLNVSKNTISKYGVVSEEVAKEMAKGAAAKNNSDIAVGISGIAGPSGGTAQKPIGTVCFGFYIKENLCSATMLFDNMSRNDVRKKSVEYATETLISLINKS